MSDFTTWFTKPEFNYSNNNNNNNNINNNFPVTDHGDPQVCDTSMLPHFQEKSVRRWRIGCQPYVPDAF
jgi:hypothetical protein